MQAQGASNNQTFRQIVSSNQLPDLSNLSCQGIFNEYYFNTGLIETKDVFEPSYNFARIQNPLTKQDEYYLGIGLNCRDDGKNLRNTTNLVVLLDISGSMNEYIPLTDEIKSEYNRASLSKISLAKDVLLTLLNNLKQDDYLGILLFNQKVKTLQNLQKCSKIHQKLLTSNIQSISATSGTNMELALQSASDMISQFQVAQSKAYANNDTRIIFITDAQPNCGDQKAGLLEITKEFASKNIFITYIGVGIDFNIKLTEQLTKIRGCNFFSVHSASQFKKILIEDFNYLMTPQVFDARVEFESQIFEIENTYGTNFSDSDTKELFKIETIMAGDKINNQIKGGMILAKLRKQAKQIQINDAQQDKLVLSYEVAKTKEKVRKSDTFNLSMQFSQMALNSFTNPGIRKAALLAVYTDFLKVNLGCLDKLNELDLNKLIEYFVFECTAMNAKDMYQEIEILQKLKQYNASLYQKN